MVTNREVREITSTGAWLDWRRKDITASRIGALFGCHKYLSREQLASQMRGDRGPPPNSAMRRGRILEPAVAAAVTEDRPEWSLIKATAYYRLTDNRIGATPDYFVDDDGLLQIKTVNPVEWDSWQGRLPLMYSLQTLTELLCTDRAWGVCAVMVTSQSFPVHYFDVPRHATAEAKIIDAAAAWWSAFDAGEIAETVEPPDIDDGSHRDLSGDNLLPALLPERAGLKADESRIKARLKEIDYEITNRVGAARTAWLPGWMISLPTINRKAYSVAAGAYRRLDVKESEHE